MRLQADPYLRAEALPSLVRQIDGLYRQIAEQVNGVTEGRIASITNAMSSPPTTGEYVQGDFIRNATPAGSSPVLGWVCVDSGTPGAWVAVRGSLLIAPPVTGWAWVNQGGATLTSTPEYQRIEGGAAGVGAQLRGLFTALPVGPYTLTAALRITKVGKGNQAAGIALRESSSGKLIVLMDLSSNTLPSPLLQYGKYNDHATFNADYQVFGLRYGELLWLRIADDGTNRTVSLSIDGDQWLAYHSVSRTDFATPDQAGFVSGCENLATPDFAPIVDLVSWSIA